MQLDINADRFGDNTQQVKVDVLRTEEVDGERVTVIAISCDPEGFYWEGTTREAAQQGLLTERLDPTQDEIEALIEGQLGEMLPDMATAAAKRINAAFFEARVKCIWF